MTTYLKLMTHDGSKSDADSLASFELHVINEGACLSFNRYSGDRTDVTHSVYVSNNGDGISGQIPLVGNAYVLSETGKTIASHGH